jgi:uncharacterized protein involved in exopolysaccharide biosynthesis
MKRSIRLGAFALVVLGATSLTSCSSKITEEQLAELTRLRDQERTLTNQVRSAEQDKNRLQSEVTAQRTSLESCNTNKQFVQGKLSQWPNVWPDWQYVEPTAPTSNPRR